MTELDIISIDEAKDWLSVEDESALPRLISSAIGWVENYTGHKLYQRPVTVTLDCPGYLAIGYPVDVVSVVDKNGDPVPYCLVGDRVKYGRGAYTLTANVGYAQKEDVPSVLIEAAFKMLTYFYENRDLYEIRLPQDVQFMVNKFRRNLV